MTIGMTRWYIYLRKYNQIDKKMPPAEGAVQQLETNSIGLGDELFKRTIYLGSACLRGMSRTIPPANRPRALAIEPGSISGTPTGCLAATVPAQAANTTTRPRAL